MMAHRDKTAKIICPFGLVTIVRKRKYSSGRIVGSDSDVAIEMSLIEDRKPDCL
jgi:hypothetical protein